MTAPIKTRKYLIHDWAGLAYVAALDFALRLLPGSRETGLVGAPNRVLVAIGGHLGDAVIASSVLPDIHAAFPGAEIGLLLPTWARVVLEGHPLVKRVHVVDHWKLDRSASGIVSKLANYGRTARRAVAELRDAHYDVAVDLYPFYPNMACVLKWAGIPVRAGYGSGGGGPALTRELPWPFEPGHMAVRHRRVIQAIGVPATQPLAYSLPPLSAETLNAVDAIMRRAGLVTGGFAVLHVGTGHPSKTLPIDEWMRIGEEQHGPGLKVVIAGHGSADGEIANMIRKRQPWVIDLVGQTTIAELRGILRHARIVVGLDSVSVHLAAAEGTPCVSIITGASDPDQWRPLSPVAEVRRYEPGGAGG